MKLIYAGDPQELEQGTGLSRLSTTVYGVLFPMGAEVDVSRLPEKQQLKLLNNPHFRAAGVDGPAVPLVLPAYAAAPTVGESDDDEAEAAAAHAARASKRKAKASG